MLENRDVAKRWLEVRQELPALEHLVLLEDAEDFADERGTIAFDELAARGREALAAEPGRFDELRAQVRPDDPLTLLYTSGTTGPPKGVVLTHRNLLYECAALDRLTGLPDGLTSVSYLPLAHIAERVLSIYDPLQKRANVWFCPDPAQAIEYVRQARPTFFFGVPRVWEKVRAGINAKLAAEPDDRRRKLAKAAVGAGFDVVRRQQQGASVPLALRARHAALDRLVLAKVRAALGLDRCQFASSAAAPLPVDVAEFFAAIGLPLIEVYGMTETSGVATTAGPTWSRWSCSTTRSRLAGRSSRASPSRPWPASRATRACSRSCSVRSTPPTSGCRASSRSSGSWSCQRSGPPRARS